MQKGKVVAIIFSIIIALFTVVASYYLYKNDFNSETLAIIFPAIGAIMFSGYLGYKSVWIDAPAPAKSKTNIALLLDLKSGEINPILPTGMDAADLTFRFRGLKKIGEYRAYNAFKNINDWEKLKKVDEDDRIVLDLLEYAIFDWFAQDYTSIGYEDRGAITMLGGAGLDGGGVRVDLIPTSVSSRNEWNPFIKAKEIKLRLSKGSKIKRDKADPFINFTIETPHSLVTIRVLAVGGTGWYVAGDALGKKIGRVLFLPEHTPGLWMLGIRIEIETSQKAFSRYSDQAKLEAIWLKRIPELFEEDFSWDKLRSYYASYTPIPPTRLPRGTLKSKK
jgi:hypothetical protein